MFPEDRRGLIKGKRRVRTRSRGARSSCWPNGSPVVVHSRLLLGREGAPSLWFILIPAKLGTF
jgi:hypothetical protein